MKKLGSLFLLLIVLAVSGCSTVPVEETYSAEIVPGEYQNAASIIFFEPHRADSMDEEDIVSCLENRIKKHNPDQAFISYNQFVNTMFPDLPDREVPRESESFSRFLADVADEKFYKDVLSWGVRYLIFVRGSTSETNGFYWFKFLPSFPPIVLGYKSWDHKTRLTASILDLHQKETVIDDLESIFEGTQWFAGFIIPIWYSPSTESDSCEDMGDRLGKILLDRSKQ